ncbi:MAG: DMT family transporter [Alphaproteobacteria bacterium]
MKINNIYINKTIKVYSFALTAILLYGLTPVITKLAVGFTDGITVGALRALVALPAALLIIICWKITLPWCGYYKWLLILSGICGLAIFPVFFSWGIQMTTAGHAAAATASAAVMAGAFDAILNKKWPNIYWWGGIAIGLAGVLLLIWEAVGLGVKGVSWQGDTLVFAGMFSGVIGYIAGAKLTHKVGAISVSLWSVCIAAIILCPVLLLNTNLSSLLQIDLRGWAAIITLAWGITIGAYILWNRAVADGGIARIGSLQLLQPVIGISLAPLLLAEPFTLTLLIATIITLFGVLLIQRK